jgi:hypothetical protein
VFVFVQMVIMVIILIIHASFVMLHALLVLVLLIYNAINVQFITTQITICLIVVINVCTLVLMGNMKI